MFNVSEKNESSWSRNNKFKATGEVKSEIEEATVYPSIDLCVT